MPPFASIGLWEARLETFQADSLPFRKCRLGTPLEPSAEIHHTLDGSAPTRDAKRYETPFTLADSAQVRAAAFDGDRAVCEESEGRFFKRPSGAKRISLCATDAGDGNREGLAN